MEVQDDLLEDYIPLQTSEHGPLACPLIVLARVFCFAFLAVILKTVGFV